MYGCAWPALANDPTGSTYPQDPLTIGGTNVRLESERRKNHMLAYDYPLFGIFWSFLWLFLWMMWLFLLFRIIADIFRSHDMGGFAKALWILFVILLPFLGVLIYVCVRGNSMAERDLKQAQHQQRQFDEYVRETAGSSSAADELTKLARLKEDGVLSDAEFAAQKAKLLA